MVRHGAGDGAGQAGDGAARAEDDKRAPQIAVTDGVNLTSTHPVNPSNQTENWVEPNPLNQTLDGLDPTQKTGMDSTYPV
jgi:hypothetical protein